MSSPIRETPNDTKSRADTGLLGGLMAWRSGHPLGSRLLLSALALSDVFLAILAYRAALLVRSLSSFGVFESPLALNTFSQPLYLLAFIGAFQVIALYVVGLYRVPESVSWWRLGLRGVAASSVVTILVAATAQILLSAENVKESVYPFFWLISLVMITGWRWMFWQARAQWLAAGFSLAVPERLRFPLPAALARVLPGLAARRQPYQPAQGDALLEEHRRWREELGAINNSLEALRNPVAGADSAVIMRLRQEYEARQRAILTRFSGLTSSLRRYQLETQRLLSNATRRLELAQNGTEELLLRLQVGEYDLETYQNKVMEHEQWLANVRAEVGHLEEQLAAFQAALAVAAPPPAHRAVQPLPAAFSNILKYLTALQGPLLLTFLALMLLAVWFTASRLWAVADVLATAAYVLLIPTTGAALYSAVQSYRSGEKDE